MTSGRSQKNIEAQIGCLVLDGTIREGQTIALEYNRGADKPTFIPHEASVPDLEAAAAW